jgi:hypothetical protein
MTEGTDEQAASAPVDAFVLLPCPFCGAKADYYVEKHDYGEDHIVDCSECWGRLQSPFAESTVDNWNRRAKPTFQRPVQVMSYQESMSKYYAAIRSQ